ncbi:MAG: type transport system ATP-binding protein [Patescibacteria group bacterium]|nr:type transport system ATP-binding protein [Patescibacteria group bacterium]
MRANIGLTGQYAAVDEYLTGRDNLNMMGRLYHLSKVDTKRRTEELLKEFDLVDAADRPAKTYSGGMRRRLDLAVSLIATPPILFLDEPTTGLDPRSRLKIWEIVERLLKEGTTILLTTQYLDEADKLADKIVVLDHGTIIASGTANELKDKVGKERLEIVLKSKNDFEKAKVAIGNDVAFFKEEEILISVTTGGSVAELKKILDKLEAGGIEVESFSLHKPTLDDVFLKLTGVGTVLEDKKEEK